MSDYNPKEIPDYPIHQAGMYTVKVVKATKNEKGSLKINCRFEITGPDDARVGAGLQNTIWLGTNEDPQAEQPATKKANFGTWTRFLKACEVQATGDLEEECETVEGSELHIKVTESKDGTKNYVNGYYRLGTQDPKLENPPVKPSVAAATDAQPIAQAVTSVDSAAVSALKDED